MSSAVKTSTNAVDKSIQLLARNMLGRAMGFSDCQPEFLDELVSAAHTQEFGKGEYIVHWNEPVRHLALIVKGSLEVVRGQRDGHRQLIGLLMPGDIIGVISVMDGLGAMNDVCARSPSTLLLVPIHDVLRFRNENRGFDMALQLYLAFRYRLQHERLSADAGIPLTSRIARILLLLSSLHGLARGKGFDLNMHLSQTDFADWLGVSRQSINAAVTQLRAEGLIKLGYSVVHILDAESLAKYAQ